MYFTYFCYNIRDTSENTYMRNKTAPQKHSLCVDVQHKRYILCILIVKERRKHKTTRKKKMKKQRKDTTKKIVLHFTIAI